jgi:putative DNA primase/helicase
MKKSDYIDIEDVAREERIRPDSAMPEDDVGAGDDFGANGSADQQRAKGNGAGAQGERPVIRIVKGEIARITDEAEAALLAAASAAPIMVRAGMLVQPIVDRLPATHGRMTEVTLLKPLTSANVIYLLNKHAAAFEHFDARSKKWLPADPPSVVATQLLEKGRWPFPKVAGVITAPTLRPDGTILDQPGYDAATQFWHAPDSQLAMPALAERPTRAQAEKALALLDALLDGFPFVGGVDRAVALTGLLTVVLRGGFDVAPMALFRAHDVSAGKSMLADLLSMVARGRPCPVITNAKSIEEMEKRLGALVLEGVPIVSLDNCSGNIGGDLLCQITERRLVRIRILGESRVPECEWRGVLVGTGNNITLTGDMTRRGVIANLDPKVERPELRTFSFDPIERVLENRGAYIAAAITAARSYVAAGRPRVCGPLGSYSEWSSTVRAPLVWLGREDPIKSMDALRDEDPARRALHDLVELWQAHLGVGIPYAANEIIYRANTLAEPVSEYGEQGHPELRDLLVQQVGTPRGDIDVKKLGHWLMSIRGRIHDGHYVERVKESGSHGNRYALLKVK